MPTMRRLARPNILMFNDYGWDSPRAPTRKRLNSISGITASARLSQLSWGLDWRFRLCVTIANSWARRLIRINPREAEVPAGAIGLPMGAKQVLMEIDALLSV